MDGDAAGGMEITRTSLVVNTSQALPVPQAEVNGRCRIFGHKIAEMVDLCNCYLMFTLSHTSLLSSVIIIS